MKELKKFFEKLWDGVFPGSICFNCGEELVDKNLSLCEECKKKFVFTNKICNKCGSPIENDTVCSICKHKSRFFEVARAPLVYEGEVKDIIWNFKYKNRTDFARYLAKFLELEFLKNIELYGKVDVIVPVPLHKNKLALRGYNQSMLLAKELSNLVHVDLDKESLVRVKNTETQTYLDFQQRQENMKDAFALTTGNLKGKNVLLVDDVFTTGATVDSSAKTLIDGGAKSVLILTVATTNAEK